MTNHNVLDPSDSDTHVRSPQPSARILRLANILVHYETAENLQKIGKAKPSREDREGFRNRVESKAIELAEMDPRQREALLRTVVPADIVEQLLRQIN